MLLSKKDKEKRVIDLANQGKTTREIAKEVYISLKSIGQILNKVTGDNEDEEKQRLESKSDYARAFKMFQDGRPLTEVAIELDIESPTVICYYEDYLKLVNMRKLVAIYNDVKNDLPLFLKLYWRIKKERLSKPQISELLKIPNRLLEIGKKVDLYNNHIWNLHEKKLKLEKEIGMLSDVLKQTKEK
jgi:hypothetical protein